jgi:hypothetical protein
MKVIQKFLIEELVIPEIKVGDLILLGKWKNKRGIVKSIAKDENGQPVVVTDKGRFSLYNFRINDLMPKDKQKTKEVEKK